MGWKESDRVSERLEFVKLASGAGANISELCRRFGVSRKTGYKWLKRWRQGGETELHDHSRRPHGSPRKTPPDIEQQVIQLRLTHPAWGGRKIRHRLLALGHSLVPAASTINGILRRHGLIDEEASQQHRAFERFERPRPNDLWQLDFKGEFRLSSGRNCYSMTLLDDHSRYALAIAACGNQRRQTVQRRLCEVFQKYGIPYGIYVDNGPPWGTSRGTRYTGLALWLMRQDIQVIHGRPYHPQGRGKLERFHRTLNLEVLQDRQFSSLKQTQRAYDPWRQVYNHERPHEALDLAVPASRYRSSPRSFQETTQEYQYSPAFETRRLNRGGQFHFLGATYRISEVFREQKIGLLPTTEDGIWKIHYCRFEIGQLNQRTGRVRRNQRFG